MPHRIRDFINIIEREVVPGKPIFHQRVRKNNPLDSALYLNETSSEVGVVFIFVDFCFHNLDHVFFQLMSKRQFNQCLFEIPGCPRPRGAKIQSKPPRFLDVKSLHRYCSGLEKRSP
jgi:hypothetical protein